MSDATPSNTPTVVLVHGAFADGSSWNGVIERLHARGVKVTAPANPLRGISIDSAYTASVFAQTPGPVLAVGHSYGGAVITNAAERGEERRRSRLRRRVCPRRGRAARRRLGRVERQHPRQRAGAPPVPDGERRHGRGVHRGSRAGFTRCSPRDLPDELTPLVAATQRPSPSWRSPSLTEPRRGRTSRRGPSSPCPTRRRAPTSSGPWPSGQARRSPKSRART